MTSCAVAGSAACSWGSCEVRQIVLATRCRRAAVQQLPHSVAANYYMSPLVVYCRWSTTARTSAAYGLIAAGQPAQPLCLGLPGQHWSQRCDVSLCSCLPCFVCIHMVVHMKSREIDLFYIHVLCWFWLTVLSLQACNLLELSPLRSRNEGSFSGLQLVKGNLCSLELQMGS